MKVPSTHSVNILTATVALLCTLSPSPVATKKQEINSGPDDLSVFDKDLVVPRPLPADIIRENAAYYQNTSHRLFTEGTTLGYVTPWNNHGYDVAKTWGKKFDIISPVWLQILRLGKQRYDVEGLHDIDENWMKDVRKAGKTKRKQTKIFPRVVFEEFRDDDFVHLLGFDEERERVANTLVEVCIDYDFDGIVLEVWSQLSVRVEDEYLVKLIIDIATILKEHHLELILVVPPMRPHLRDLFNSNHFDVLYRHVAGFSFMTYDYSINDPGPIAPLDWMRNSVEHICPDTLSNYRMKREKILLGLNMYGTKMSSSENDAIVGEEYLRFLRKYKEKLPLDEEAQENFFELIATKMTIHYPTLYSINERIKLARELNTGLSIWELGQGLDYFYDLL